MKKVSFYIISLALLALFLEGTAVLFYLVRNGEYRHPSEMYPNPNVILQAFNEQDCSWAQTLAPHPYLAYVHIPGDACRDTKWNFNRLGFFGTEIPLERDERFYDILLTGGSAAALLGQMSRVGPNFLELALNENYESPTGQPFRVLHGAVGGWQQPHQLVMTAIYGPTVSAIVTLEGFNELQRFFDSVPYRLSRQSWPTHDELVARNFQDVPPITNAQMISYVGKAFSGTPVIGDSTFLFAIYDLVRALVMQEDISSLTNVSESGTTKQKDYESSFSFPESMSAEQRIEWNVRQYRHYLTMIDAMAKRMGIRSAFFLQPVPRIDKPLTREELSRMSYRRYEKTYQKIVDGLLTLREGSVEVISVLDTYSGMTEPIYADSIHPRFDWVTGESKGLRILADRMARELARAWQLGPKRP